MPVTLPAGRSDGDQPRADWIAGHHRDDGDRACRIFRCARSGRSRRDDKVYRKTCELCGKRVVSVVASLGGTAFRQLGSTLGIASSAAGQ